MSRLVFLVAIALSLHAQAPSTMKVKKLAEIDQRISALEREADALRALRNSVANGQIPEAALAALNIQSGAPVASSAIATAQSNLVVQEAPKSASVAATRPAASAPASASIYHLGPRGGCYTLTSGGNKRYVDRSMCH